MRRWSTSRAQAAAARSAAATAALVVLAAVSIGCSTPRASDDPPASVPTPATTQSHGDSSGGPPPFTVRYDTTELVLAATSWCWGNSCADGYDTDPPSVGSPDELFVFVPLADFTALYASQRGDGEWCDARTVDAVTTSLGGGWWSVTPQGPADRWTLDFFAQGDGGGDMAASLVWQTTEDLPLPPVDASLTLIADHDGVPDSYGVELYVDNLTAAPDDATAQITVTAANGESLTFDATRSTDCTGEGSLFFDGPDAQGVEAAALGDFPFTYDVVLTIDGVAHTASGVYPDDAPPQELGVPLEFAPAPP